LDRSSGNDTDFSLTEKTQNPGHSGVHGIDTVSSDR
jgi:hypothetical protein